MGMKVVYMVAQEKKDPFIFFSEDEPAGFVWSDFSLGLNEP